MVNMALKEGWRSPGKVHGTRVRPCFGLPVPSGFTTREVGLTLADS